ncbi:Aste57867_12271 [Aphanomyces stellatus]|uniref:Aste57867_12271 protein n=1 Tax=Aphanomyces stellatus TaxID=120398 RepID=A0A485KVR1_9STRA|nr:hypothetical protein As57867_012226 [Aphanomyces stellatus]VFT89124.1 Aste57867_12271 [Aphanomyces stellatus]
MLGLFLVSITLVRSSVASSYDIATSPPSGHRPDVYAACQWRGPSAVRDEYILDLVSETTQGDSSPAECFPNVFAVGAPLAVPFPRSSYGYDLAPDTQYTPSDTNPHIHVNGYAIDQVLDVDVSYSEWEHRGAEIIYDALPHVAGVYRIDLQAFDFGGNDADASSHVCATCLAVTDRFRPFGTKGDCTDQEGGLYSPTAVQTLQSQVAALVKYRQTARNNACSDTRCDALVLRTFDFFAEHAIEDTSSSLTSVQSPLTTWTTCLSRGLSDSEWTRLTMSPIHADGSVETTRCVRRCDYSISLKEWYTAFACHEDSGQRTCVGSPTETCSFHQSLGMTADTLVSAIGVHLSSSRVPNLIASPDDVFPGLGYQPPSPTSLELHLDIACDVQSPGFAMFCAESVRFKLTDLFELRATLSSSSDIQALVAGRVVASSDASAMVFWRVKNTQADTWHEIVRGKSLYLSFGQFKSNVIFEAYTACGQVGQAITWTVYAHRREVVHMDDWWYNLWRCGAGSCNVPHTDFRLCTFKFDPSCSAYLGMLNPETSTHAVPINKATGVPLDVCEYNDDNGVTQTCSGGCWWHYTTCDTAVTEDACDERRRQEGSRFVYCGGPTALAAPAASLLQDTLLDSPVKTFTLSQHTTPSCTDVVANTKTVTFLQCYPYAEICNYLDGCTLVGAKSVIVDWGIFPGKGEQVRFVWYPREACDGSGGALTAQNVACVTGGQCWTATDTKVVNGKSVQSTRAFHVKCSTQEKGLPDVDDVKIKWDFYGLQCKWQYTLAAETTNYWLDTTNLGKKQELVVKDLALKMQNVDVTELTALCDFYFKLRHSDAPAVKRSRNKTVLIRNCDHPRFNVGHPGDGGVFVKDTCAAGAWATTADARRPAPFQACAGALVFPNNDDVTSARSVRQTKTMFVETTTDLACCNPNPLVGAPFTCRQFSERSPSIKLCSDSTANDVGEYYQGMRSPEVYVFARVRANSIVIGGALLVGVVVLAGLLSWKTHSDIADVDVYVSLGH